MKPDNRRATTPDRLRAPNTEAFVTLQNNRHLADYALDAKSYRESDVVDEIKVVESTISRFEGTDAEARRSFAAHVLFGRRP